VYRRRCKSRRSSKPKLHQENKNKIKYDENQSATATFHHVRQPRHVPRLYSLPMTCHVIRWPPYMASKRPTMTNYGVQSIRRCSLDVTWRPGLRCVIKRDANVSFSARSTLPRTNPVYEWPDKKGKGAYSCSWNSPQNYGTSFVNGITQCYLPPDKVDLHPNRAGWYSIYRPRKDERLSWPSWLVTYRDGLPVHRRSPIQVLTGSDVTLLRWSRPTRYH